MSDYTVVIPARHASTRLPGKPLLDIVGKPMIQRVYEQAVQSQAKSVLVATDDERIADVVRQFGGDCIMTRADHESGTDRLQQVVSDLGLSNDAIVVNVQGDEPLIPPAVIDQVAGDLEKNTVFSAATLCEEIESNEDFLNPNIVKLVKDPLGKAIYFSRAPIPWPRNQFAITNDTLPDDFTAYRHIGIYAYRVELLNQFVQWPTGQLESWECLEQLRVLENNRLIHVSLACEKVPGGVDTKQDFESVCQILKQSPA